MIFSPFSWLITPRQFLRATSSVSVNDISNPNAYSDRITVISFASDPMLLTAVKPLWIGVRLIRLLTLTHLGISFNTVLFGSI